jgi:DNA modification methylase
MCYVSYWGIKHAGAFRDVLKDYSSVIHDVVLDPYGGSGELIKSMLILGKRAIYNDLNPIARLVARYNIARSSGDIDEARKCLIKVKSKLSDLAELYREYCPKCSLTSEVVFRVYNNGAVVSHLKCGHVVNSSDISLSESLMPKWINVKLTYGGKPFLKARKNLKLGDLFTGRGALTLSTVLDAISDCPEVAKYMMIPVIYLLSKMAFLPRSKESVIMHGRKWKPSWAIPAYWLPGRFIEFNPLSIIDVKLMMLNRCKASQYKVGNVDEVISGDAHVAFLNSDAGNLPLPDESVDIITDPPYPTDIQYGELYFIFATLLGINDYDEVLKSELIINRNRGFTINDYLSRLNMHMAEFYRVAKSNAIFILKKSKHTESMESVIERYFNIKEVKEVNVRKRRSRIGNYNDYYNYMILFCNKLR